MTLVLGTYSIKGGVGKTTAAVNLAHLAAARGARVLLWDLDPQGAATWTFRVRARLDGGAKELVRRRRPLAALAKGTDTPRLDLIPSDFSHRYLDLLLDARKKPRRRLQKRLDSVSDDYDYVFLDCPPGITLVSENVFQAADALLVPLVPTTLSLRTLEQLLDFLARERWGDRVLLPFFSMVDRRRKLHREILVDLPRRVEGMLETVVPNASDVERMALLRAPVTAFAPSCPAARAFEQLWREIETRLWRPDAVRILPSAIGPLRGLGEMGR